MGLIKAAIGALGGTLADSWQETIHCPQMDNKTIIRCGTKRSDGNSRTSNTKGNENIISNGSAILVEENTCMLTIDNGKITNVVTEPGRYILDNSTAPSIFAGQIKDSFKDLWDRIKQGGTPSSEQRVIYINLMKLPGIPFGTGSPMPYFDPRYNTSIELRFFGSFEVEIPDAEHAVRFYQEVGNKGVNGGDMSVASVFQTDQYKNEFIMAMSQALGGLSSEGVSYSQISSNLLSLTAKTREATLDSWQQRGIIISSIGMQSPTLSAESQKRLDDRLKADTMLGADVQKAMMATSLARGIEAAGSNEGGAMMGVMGMNAMMNTGGNILGQMDQAAMQQQQQMQQQQMQANAWKCSCGAQNTGAFCASCGTKKPEAWTCSCGTQNTGKFCANCGASKEKLDAPQTAPAAIEWTCACGNKNTTKFCAECGAQKPKKYRCDKCGWAPAEGANPPKFCPECGDPFNDADLV